MRSCEDAIESGSPQAIKNTVTKPKPTNGTAILSSLALQTERNEC